jgi:GNAT superfamily N-acetyltransferase
LHKNEIIDLFDAQVRANPVANHGVKLVPVDNVTRLEGAFNFICNWSFDEKTAMQAVKAQADYFRQLGETLIWRVYDHDKPSNLAQCLTEQGFEASPQGTLMVLPLDDNTLAESGHDIRLVTSSDTLRDYVAVAELAFADDDIGDVEYFEKLMAANDFALFCGYADGEPAVSALLQIQPDSVFGLLFGGGVPPAHRGKGFYKASVAARAALARSQGLKYLATDARETSRPILESLGFIPLVRETTWLLPKMPGVET